MIDPSDESFHETKYKDLMDGLECSEMKCSEAVGAGGNARWDSEYYGKDYIHVNNILMKNEVVSFSNLCKSIKKGIFDLSPSVYKECGVPFIRTSEIKKPTINFNSTAFIDEKINIENGKTILSPYDIVFTKIGAYIGDVAILPNNYTEYNFSQNVAGASLKNKLIGPYLLFFFLSKFGRAQILRSVMLSGQGKLELADIRNYKVPVFSNDFTIEIRDLFKDIEEKEKNAVLQYECAVNNLSSFINIDGDQFNEQYSIKTFSSSLIASERLDAEYYQPKYDRLFENLSRFRTFSLGGANGLVNIQKSIEPGSEYYHNSGIPFIRVSDVDKFEISMPDIKLPKDIVVNVENLFPKKNTILFSKDGSVGIAYKVQDDMEVVTSGALLHLTVKDTDIILPDYLTLVLNSPIVQMQAERDSNGAVIQHWKPSDIEKVIIPVLDMEVQMDIAEKVQESFRLKKESKQLIEIGIKTLEMAIETDEKTAVYWLKSQI